MFRKIFNGSLILIYSYFISIIEPGFFAMWYDIMYFINYVIYLSDLKEDIKNEI